MLNEGAGFYYILQCEFELHILALENVFPEEDHSHHEFYSNNEQILLIESFRKRLGSVTHPSYIRQRILSFNRKIGSMELSNDETIDWSLKIERIYFHEKGYLVLDNTSSFPKS